MSVSLSFLELITLESISMALFGWIDMAEETFDMIVKIVLSVVIILIGLGLGLWFRNRLVKRLGGTFLDAWVVQTLGMLIVIPFLLLGGLVAFLIWNDFSRFIQNQKIDLFDVTRNLIVSLLLVALAIGVARTLNKIVQRGINGSSGESRLDVNMRTFLGRLINVIVFVVASFWCLSIWNIEIGIPVAAVGIITLIVTVSIQDILKDFVAGFYLLLTRPFYIGDLITVTIAPNVYTGRVQEVQMRFTRVRLLSGEETILPNAALFNNTVINHSFYGERRITIELKVPLADFSRGETAYKIIQKMSEVESVLSKPEPSVLFNGVVEEKVILLVRCWYTGEPGTIANDVLSLLYELIPTAGMIIREPVNTL